MKKKAIWLMLSFLLVAALLLASCTGTTPEEEEVVPEEFPTMENFEPQFSDEFGAADEYDMDFDIEEDELSDVLSELGWEEESED